MSIEVRAQNTLSMTSVKAIKDATDEATTLLDGMRQSAIDAGTTLNGIYQDAEGAKTNAEQAQVSATQASEYASRALGNLASVQSVTETLNWITAHGTMTKTTDIVLDPTHVYFVRDNNGDYVVGNYHYSVVTEPSTADLGDYYELSIDESLNNYVATHLAVDSEGLWILPDSGGNKVLIATGQGNTYTTAGTYIVGNNNVVLAGFGEETFIGNASSGQIRVNSNAIMGNIDNTQMFSLDLSGGIVNVQKEIFYNVENLPMTANYTVTIPSGITFASFLPVLEAPDHNGGVGVSKFTYGTSATKVWKSLTNAYQATIQYDGDRTITIGSWTPNDATYTFSSISYRVQGNAPAYTFGTRNAEVEAGGYSMGIGDDVKATAYCSYAEGYGTEANNAYAHAEGYNTVAQGSRSHAEGEATTAYGQASHAEGDSTTANGNYSHAEGSYTTTHDRGAHAEGYGSIARGQYSHAQNLSTEARHKAQTVIGTYNVVEYTEPTVAVHPSGDTSYGRYALAVGNGIDPSNSSNAFTVDWAGRIECGDHSGQFDSIFNIFYPVGSYYETSDTTFDPNVTWGGTWSLETAGQVHVSAGTGYTVSGALTNTTDGGEATHTLDTTEIPAHTHGNKSLTGTWGNSASRFPDTSNRSGIITNLSATRASYFSKTSNSASNAYGFSIDASHEHDSVGGGGAHNNMQPYIIVNRWHRTA